jgi:DNA-binding beta-propeller fold protein YncE
MRKSVLVLLCALANSPAAAKDTGLIFVSNEKTNNIVAIDPASYKIVKEIKTARRPRDLHFNADHSKLYVACGDDDVIDIVDVAKLEVVGQLKTGPSPEAFGIDEKRGRLYVSQEEGSSLAVIDMEHDAIVQEVATGAEPEGVLVSEDGKTVYVTSEAGDLLHEVAADSGNIVRDVVAGLRPRRIAATPDGKELWVTAELAGEVDIVDRATFAITGKIPFLPPGMRKSEVTPVGLVMTKDGRTAFVALGHAAHDGAGRRAGPQSLGLHPGRQKALGPHPVARREHALCRQRLRRRHHRDRHQDPQGENLGAGRPHSLWHRGR